MVENVGELQTFNADKQIAVERDLPLILNLMRAFRQTRTGETPVKSMYNMTDNEKVLNKVSGLIQIIHALRDLIELGWSKIYTPCFKKWELDTSEDKLSFEKEDNDFNKLMEYREFLKFCQQKIVKADRTPTLKDDFKAERINKNGEVEFFVTENYDEMLEEFEVLWPKIDYLLSKYAVLNRGFIKDEDITEQEKEDELKRRILQS